MLEVKDAVTKLLAHFSPLPVEEIPFDTSLGRILAEPIIADKPFPLFTNSSMDGFAVKAENLKNASQESPVILDILGVIPAGFAPEFAVSQGTAAKIMTGAELPPGADAVIPIEDTNQNFGEKETTTQVEIYKEIDPGDNIRIAGENFKPGDHLIESGKKIGPAEIALFALSGKTSIKVFKKPKIGILVTGDELVSPFAIPAPGQIPDTNSYMLTSLLKKQDVEILNSGIVEDSEEKIWHAIKNLIDDDVDLIISSGGVSMGAYDFVRIIIEKHGSLNFWRVNMKPGKPLAFGHINETPIIGLPGNPVSAYVGFNVFIVPTLQKLAGITNPSQFLIQATLLSPLQAISRESYIPAMLENSKDGYTVTPIRNQSSGNLFSLVQTNSLIILPGGVEFFNIGDNVNVWKTDCHYN